MYRGWHNLRLRGAFLVLKQVEKLRTGHLPEHGQGQWIRLGVVVYIDVQAVHHIEVRIGKQLLHGGVAYCRVHAACDEGLEVRIESQSLCVFQRRLLGDIFGHHRIRCLSNKGLFCRQTLHWLRQGLSVARIRFALRPATQKTLSHGAALHRHQCHSFSLW